GGNVLMRDLGRGAGFAQESKPCRLVAEVFFVDHFQCDGAPKIDVERFVSYPHRPATQLERLSILVIHQFIMLEPMRDRRGCCLGRRLASFGFAGESLPKHADRAEFNCSRKLFATSRANPSVHRFHGPNRPSDMTRASKGVWVL